MINSELDIDIDALYRAHDLLRESRKLLKRIVEHAWRWNIPAEEIALAEKAIREIDETIGKEEEEIGRI